jgi:hypothetical protein
VAVDGLGNLYVVGETSGTLLGQTRIGDVDAYVVKFDRAGALLWTRQFGTPAKDWARGVAVDGVGDLYVVGETYGTLPGQTSSGGIDAYVVKFDGAGTLLWTRQFGTPVNECAEDVVVDGVGNVCVVGGTGGALPGQTSAGRWDAFAVKFDGAGTLLWTRQFGSSDHDYVESVAVDGAGNFYAAGWAYNALPGQTHAGASDAFVAKFNVAGTLLWTRQFGTSADDSARGVAVDGLGNLYVAGGTGSALSDQTHVGETDAFAAKFDGAGTLLWTHQFGDSDDDYAQSVAVDGLGNLYVVGRTEGALPGQTSIGGKDAFVVELDGVGNLLWTHQFGDSDDDHGEDVAVDGLGNLYVVGQTLGALSGQTQSGEGDAFIVKLR